MESKSVKKSCLLYLVAANDRFMDYLLNSNKFKNVFKNQERYPKIELRELHNLGIINCILLSSKPYPFKQNLIKIQKKKNLTPRK